MRVLKCSSVDYVAYFNTISVILTFSRVGPKKAIYIFLNFALNYCRYSRLAESG